MQTPLQTTWGQSTCYSPSPPSPSLLLPACARRALSISALSCSSLPTCWLEELSFCSRFRSRRGRRGYWAEATPCCLRFRSSKAGDCIPVPIKPGLVIMMQQGQDGNGALESELELQRTAIAIDECVNAPKTVAVARSFSRDPAKPESELQCIGTGSDVECVISHVNNTPLASKEDQLDSMECISTGADVNNTPLASREDQLGSMECIGTGADVECVIPDTNVSLNSNYKIAARATSFAKSKEPSLDSVADASTQSTLTLSNDREQKQDSFLRSSWEFLVLISPFFFWGTAMVVMKGVLPKAGPLFVAATRLIPSGFLLVAFATYKKRKQPSGLKAWLAITVFALVDASCFQGFLAEGLRRTSAGLGSVIIDSQPLTVAVLASILFGETIGILGAVGLATGVIGLLLLEVPTHVVHDFLKGHAVMHVGNSSTLPSTAVQAHAHWSIWDSGEWWMLLAAQSMAIGTVMVRWLCQFADPVMATGWHMVLGGLPLLVLASIQHDPALDGHIGELQLVDWLALLYTSVFGSAVSYGVFFYNASRGSLTKLSSLTFLTPMFAAFFGFIFLNETLNTTQIVGALVTLASIYMINMKTTSNKKDDIV